MMHLPTFWGITAFWIFVGIFGPILVPLTNNRGLIQCGLIMSAVCCWLFWALAYLHQQNPLIGPTLQRSEMLCIGKEWQGGFLDDDSVHAIF